MNTMLRLLAWTLAVLLVALPVVAVVNGWVGAERWPLRTLRVEGALKRVDGAQLQRAVLPYARRGFFAVQLADAQAAVARLPWVEHAEVSKRWPDILEVRVIEHRPFARWGDKQLLSEHGKLFPAAGVAVPRHLPRLAGPDSRVADVVALYNQSRAFFAPGGNVVTGVALDRRGSWSLDLSSGTHVVVGSSEARLRLARFSRLLPQLLSQQRQPLARADLRYTNGFALMWQEKQDASAKDAKVAKTAEEIAIGKTARARMTDSPLSMNFLRPLRPLRTTPPARSSRYSPFINPGLQT